FQPAPTSPAKPKSTPGRKLMARKFARFSASRLLSGLLISSSAWALEPVNDLAPEYDQQPGLQVEVVIFSQQDVFGNERPRRDVDLTFPERSIFLGDLEKITEIQQPKSAEALTDPCRSVDSFSDPVSDPDSVTDTTPDFPLEVETTPDADEPIEETLSSDTEHEPEIPPVKDETVLSFIELQSDNRELNPDAYTLQRASGYRVLYHAAWRQPALPPNTSPWVLVRGGEQYGDHFELEGAIRVYQRRYTHAEVDVWRARFSQSGYGLPSASALDNSEPEGSSSESVAEPLQQPWPPLPAFPEPPEEPEQPELLCPESTGSGFGSAEGFVEMESQETEDQDIVISDAPLYVVTDLQRLNQSIRLDYTDLNYLDHPGLGVLIKISPYEPPVVEDEISLEDEDQSAAPAAREAAIQEDKF
ncbi:MAG: CsiV family protein, partial [bacterium]